jgi:hypothetical protein
MHLALSSVPSTLSSLFARHWRRLSAVVAAVTRSHLRIRHSDLELSGATTHSASLASSAAAPNLCSPDADRRFLELLLVPLLPTLAARRPASGGLPCPRSLCEPPCRCPCLPPCPESVSGAVRYERYDDSPFNHRSSKVGWGWALQRSEPTQRAPACAAMARGSKRVGRLNSISKLPLQWKEARGAYLSKGGSAGKVVV